MAAILALETSSDACSVALATDDALHVLEHDEARAHARVLLPTIETLLGRARLSCAQLAGIVYGQGPGSFTGLRIGCAVAQGLAWAHELPTLGVSSLAVLAEAALREHAEAAGADGACTPVAGVVTVLDARMEEFYLAIRGADGERSVIVADSLVAREALADVLAAPLASRPGRWLLAGDGAAAAAELVAADALVLGAVRPDAEALLALAAPRLASEGAPATAVRPVYLRDESPAQRN